MRLLVAVPLIVLSSCNAPIEKDLGTCKLEARRAYPAEEPFGSYKVHEFTNLCMNNKGYKDVPIDDKSCSGSFEDAKCYIAPSPVERLFQ